MLFQYLLGVLYEIGLRRNKYTTVLSNLLEKIFNPLNAELNSICHLLAFIGTHPVLHVSRIRVKDSKDICYQNY
jgi:hypothetical protein